MTTTSSVNHVANSAEFQAAIARIEADKVTSIALAAAEGSRRSVTADLALRLSISQHQAGAEITTAIALTTRLPCTFAALQRGDINLQKASKVVEPTLGLPDELARRVDEVMATRLAGKDPSSIRAAVNRVIQKLDPAGYKE